ncbi:MAG: hypothetical protein IJW78_03425 [Clostridia bacterium]|nr:hypothetical protein [Clostridia bacterium]
MYKFINEHRIELFTGRYIKDESTDTMYVRPGKEILLQLGYMELERAVMPTIGENQYVTEGYAVKDGRIHVQYTVQEIPEEVTEL